MKKLFFCIVFLLTGCSIFKTNDCLVKINQQYSDVEVIIPNNCFQLYNFFLTETQSYSIDWEPRHTLIYDKGLGYMLSEETEDKIFDKLLAACEACETEYPQKSQKFKTTILEMKKKRDVYIDEQQRKKAEKEKKEQKIKQEKEKTQKLLKDMEKQYGYPWCSPRYLFFTQDKCMDSVSGIWFHVLQQTPDGTLVSFIKDPSYTLFISKNPKESSLVDGSPIYDGLFAVDGIYQYISVLGSTRTVKKLKRLK